MKIRTGFVSNSSSSSFIVKFPNGLPKNMHEFKHICNPPKKYSYSHLSYVFKSICQYSREYTSDFSHSNFIKLFKLCDNLNDDSNKYNSLFYYIAFLDCKYNPLSKQKSLSYPFWGSKKIIYEFKSVIHKIILDCLIKEKMFLPDIYNMYINPKGFRSIEFGNETDHYNERFDFDDDIREILNNALYLYKDNH